jgi:hypothetical protein
VIDLISYAKRRLDWAPILLVLCLSIPAIAGLQGKYRLTPYGLERAL